MRNCHHATHTLTCPDDLPQTVSHCQDANFSSVGDPSLADHCLNSLDLGPSVAARAKNCFTNGQCPVSMRVREGVKGCGRVWEGMRGVMIHPRSVPCENASECGRMWKGVRVCGRMCLTQRLPLVLPAASHLSHPVCSEPFLFPYLGEGENLLRNSAHRTAQQGVTGSW